MLRVPCFAGEFVFEPASYVLHKCLCVLVLCYCIYGCSAGTRLKSDNQDSIDEKNESLQMTFIDFKATGNEPSWVLEIDFGNQMHFKSLNHPNELFTPVPEPDIAQDFPVERYRGVTDQGELIVSIIPDSCMDNMSGEKSPFSVTVDVKLSNEADYTEFKGCGRYILDNRLHNIWVVKEMDGKKVNADDFSKGLPTLELRPSEGRISGHDGCNRLFGKIENQQGELRFSAMGSTRMACPNMENSDLFLKLISDQSFSYYFESGQLVLKKGDEVVMRLKNVD